jgi:hypothetical protein
MGDEDVQDDVHSQPLDTTHISSPAGGATLPLAYYDYYKAKSGVGLAFDLTVCLRWLVVRSVEKCLTRG